MGVALHDVCSILYFVRCGILGGQRTRFSDSRMLVQRSLHKSVHSPMGGSLEDKTIAMSGRIRERRRHPYLVTAFQSSSLRP